VTASSFDVPLPPVARILSHAAVECESEYIPTAFGHDYIVHGLTGHVAVHSPGLSRMYTMQLSPVHLARAPRFVTVWSVDVDKFAQPVGQPVGPRAQHLLTGV